MILHRLDLERRDAPDGPVAHDEHDEQLVVAAEVAPPESLVGVALKDGVLGCREEQLVPAGFRARPSRPRPQDA